MNVELIDHMGSDLSVVNAARVSFAKRKKEMDKKDKKLIRYLAKHNHISPFHHTFITMKVKAPVFVARQLVKHKFMPWNEVSRRYVDDEPEFYVPAKMRNRAKDVKQGSSDEVVETLSSDVPEYPNWRTGLEGALRKEAEAQVKMYQRLLKNGVAPEEARMVLGQWMYTEWYWSGTLSAWSSMYNLRAKPDTQSQTREIAMKAGKILNKLYPVSWEALTE